MASIYVPYSSVLRAAGYRDFTPVLASVSAKLSALSETDLSFPPCFVRILSQVPQQLKKRVRLTHEESHGGQEINHTHGNALRISRADDGTGRKFAAEEWTWLRHNQICFEELAGIRQIWKGH